jgi:Ca-activated chloride channel family protein
LQEGADKDKVREAIVDIALKHHLVTRHTSLVAVDVTPARPDGEPYDSQALPVNLPHGWSQETVSGSLPKTATPAAMHMILALLVAFAALLVYLRGRRMA